MDTNELVAMTLDELMAFKKSAELAQKQAAIVLSECKHKNYLATHELALRKIGLRIGDDVQVAGKLGGKENPRAQFAGFEGSTCYWPLVRLYKKDGKLSDVPMRCYGYMKLTKLNF